MKRGFLVQVTKVWVGGVAQRALVYIIRETHLGFGVDTWSFCNDKYIGMNRGRSYFYAYVEPGRHLMWSKAENISPYEMTFERGKTCYFLEDIMMGAFSARVRLGPISEEDGKALIDKHEFKMLASTEAGLRRGETFAAKHYSKALENWEKREKKESGEGEHPPAQRKNR